MKILILGSGGMAGHVIGLYFQENGYDVTALSRKKLPFFRKNILGDVTDIECLKCLFKENFDVVINCVGILNKDAEENKSLAVFLNSYFPHLISDLLSGSNTKFVHMSTDCVFAGNSGPYFEDSLRDGLTFYDRTKALGEIEAGRHLTFRNSIIGPDINNEGIGLFNWFMKQTELLHGYKGAIWTGVTTITLAKAMEKAIDENLSGLYNLVNNDSISKFDLLCLFNKHFKGDSLEIIENNSFKVDKKLVCTRTDFSFQVPSYIEMIEEMKKWIIDHHELYNYRIFC